MAGTSLRPVEGSARWAIYLLFGTIALDVIAIGSNVWHFIVIDRYLNGDATVGALQRSDSRQSLVSILKLVVLLLTAIMFITWFHAAYKNIGALGGALRHKAGWAIGAWFVPILNLWRPRQIAGEIWDAGAQSADEPPSHLLNLWWTLWLVSAFVGNIAARSVFGTNSLADIRDRTKADIAALVVEIGAAVAAILVVHEVTRRNVEREHRGAGRLGAPVGTGIWDETAAFLEAHTNTDDTVGRMSAASLSLLRQLRSRWESTIDCNAATGLGLTFSLRDAPSAGRVRVEPSVEGPTDATVVVSLLPGQFTADRPGAATSGDICSLAQAPAVIDSFLAQIAAPPAFGRATQGRAAS